MSESKALSPIAEQDYEAIEAAVMETQRGRWFLAEYARRNRNADTTVILDAIARLENAVAHEREGERLDRLRFDLVEMARAITSTKREIAAIRPAEGTTSDLEVASEALDGIVRTTERATSDILEAAENVQEAAWTLREDGAREDLCDELDRRATEIYTSCSFQDLTAQRTKRIIETLRFLEGRINAMIDIWGGSVDDVDADASADEPRPDGLQSRLDVFEGLDQDAIDGVIVEDAEIVTRPTLAVVETVEVDAVEEAEFDAGAYDVAFEIEDEGALAADAEDALPASDPLELVDASEDLAFVEVSLAHEPRARDTDSASGAPDTLGEADEPTETAFDLQAFAEIDRLSTREKLARFS